jgi:O-acetyl-ADP-ribose deacetylase (regulator of RNase III)
MIHQVEGDILFTNAQVLAHGIAPNDHFDSGLALSLRTEWPIMYKDFRHYCHAQHPKPGTLWTWGGVGGVRIVNLFTQEEAKTHSSNPGKAKVKHVNHALRALRKLIEKEGFQSVALPKLATGVGSLDWNDVEPLIERHLGDLGIPVYVYTTYHSGLKANEPSA